MDAESPKLHLLQLGQEISAIGQIEQVFYGELELYHGELVE
jgi:hypothetical protein